LKAGVSQADIVAGLWVLNGILAALVARERTGRGQRVDASLLEGQISLLAYYTTNFWATGEPPERLGNQHPNLAPYGTYRCKDSWITVGAGNDSLFARLCGVLGDASLAARAEFATNSGRLVNREALEEALAPLFASLDADRALSLLRVAGVPAGRVRTVPEVLEDPQALAREMVVSLPHAKIPDYRTTGFPVKLSATPGRPRSAPPLLGEHTDKILGELGYDAPRIAALRKATVV
jgi:crotonobetainyl-CoA:carnitine CoA-transferase CaiB-like acyl-CoA transferase